MTAIVALLGGWRATCFAALCVALGATALLLSSRLSDARDAIEALKIKAEVLATAQAGNNQVIDDLREVNQAWALKCATNTDAANAAAAASEQDSGALPANDQRRANDRGVLYDNDQDAAAWGRMRVPDGVARRLRE